MSAVERAPAEEDESSNALGGSSTRRPPVNPRRLTRLHWLAVVRCDYDVLTAGALGCPPERRTTHVLHAQGETRGAWRHLRAEFVIPSSLHRLRDARRPDPLYYVAFGLPDGSLVDARQSESYAPVAMVGEMLYRRLDARTTFAFGAMFPHTDEGAALRARVMRRMCAQFDAPA